MIRNLLIGTALAGCLGPGALAARAPQIQQTGSKPTVLCSAYPLDWLDWKPTDSAKAQLDRDVPFFLATLCRDPMDFYLDHKDGKPAWKDTDLKAALAAAQDGQKRIRILARVFAAMAYGNLKFCHSANAAESGRKPWPWPLASALAHGQRVVFHCKGFDALDLYKLFVDGKVSGENSVNRFDYDVEEDDAWKDTFGRTAATHGFDWVDGQMKEVKLGSLAAGWRGLFGQHHGINLPLGGVGNPWLDRTHLVGPVGYALDAGTLGTDSKFEHGHLYMHHANLKSKDGKWIVEGGLMVGIEGSEYSKTNMFDATHTIGSGKSDQTKEVSVFGGQKWTLLAPQDGPAEYGGKWVELELRAMISQGMANPNPNFEELQKVIQAVDKLKLGDPKAQKFLKALLSVTPQQNATAWPPKVLIMDLLNHGLAND